MDVLGCRRNAAQARLERLLFTAQPPQQPAPEASLIDGPLHGYAIVQRAAELSDGAVRLSTGTLYGLLERATTEALVVAGEPYTQNGRQRRDYALTPAGRTALRAEALRLEHAGRLVARRLRVTTPAVAS